MPTVYEPGYMGNKAYTLAKAAAANALLQLHCCGCHRRVNILAADFLHLHSADRDAFLPPFPCSKCKSTEWIDVRVLCVVSEYELGKYPVRRLVGIREVPIWRNEMLGDSWPVADLPKRDVKITRSDVELVEERLRKGQAG